MRIHEKFGGILNLCDHEFTGNDMMIHESSPDVSFSVQNLRALVYAFREQCSHTHVDYPIDPEKPGTCIVCGKKVFPNDQKRPLSHPQLIKEVGDIIYDRIKYYTNIKTWPDFTAIARIIIEKITIDQ